jgi:hypothetical protein
VRSAAKVIERVIAKNLYTRLGQRFVNHEDWTLIDYVGDLKRFAGGD